MEGLLDVVSGACAGSEGLQAAIVFGSALESETPGDVDLALLWSPELGTEERWKRANRIAGEIEHALSARGLNVDVKDLRSLPLVLQHRVLQTGVTAYVTDKRALVRFNSEIVPQALDFLPFYRRALRAAASRLAKKGTAP